MPRPTDVASKATAESRRKGALAANAKRRELGLSLRERIARHLEHRAGELADAFVIATDSRNDTAAGTTSWAACAEAVAEIVRAIREDEAPKPLDEIPPAVFDALVQALPTRARRPPASATEAPGVEGAKSEE